MIGCQRLLRRRNDREQGYSLIEIMVAMSLLTVIVVLLLGSLNQTQKGLKASGAQTDTLESGRAFLNLLSREMQETVNFQSGVNNAFRFACTYRTSDPLLQTIPGLPGVQRTNELMSFSFVVRSKETTDWKAIFYDFDKNDLNTLKLGSLFRAEQDFLYRESSNNLAKLQNNFISWSYSAANSTNFFKMLERVVHLKFFAYDQNGFLIPTWTVPGGYRGYFFTNQVVNPTAPSITPIPSSIEIELGILDPDVYKKVKSMGSTTAIQNFLSDRSGNVQVFRQRITIPSGP